MPSGTNERTIVYVVDDDASMRSALELFEAVGLDTKIVATARDFLTASLADKPGCISSTFRCPT
jgi:FixJ family two-component response regulator